MYTIPFDAVTLKKIISEELDSPTINYKDSKIKGKNLLTYFSNLKYKEVTLDLTDVSVEERSELVKEYIKYQSMVKLDQLISTVIKVLFCYKGLDISKIGNDDLDSECLNKSILSNDEVKEFVVNNTKLVGDLVSILDGTLLYAIKNLNAYKEVNGTEITNNVIVESTEVGKTFVNLFQNETFNCYYYCVLPNFSHLKYFEHYFDRPIYLGKTLISYLGGECVIFPLLNMVMENKFTLEQLINIQKEADATLV